MTKARVAAIRGDTEECLKAGAKRVIIGDGSHLPTFDWQYAVTLDGSTHLLKEAGRLSSIYKGVVSLACLETDSPAWIEVPSHTSPWALRWVWEKYGRKRLKL
ncbi:MAG: hypothetical protein EHM72_04325 [Calditrichaeota bacterium]|nr:MAG: hypothetical protein EHM72_04325 [Calditrichota bacterium]